MANYRLLAGISLVIGLVALVFICLLYSLTGGEVPFDHGVILDAGSSHTEALLYHWHGEKYRGTGYVEQLHECQVEDGISSFDNPLKAGASLLPCLEEMARHVPEDKRATTPVYLGATAGMRLLNVSNRYLNLATFTAIQCTLPSSGFQTEQVGIISGQDEGIFAWITVNFLMGNLQRKQHPTVGALDMGGASTQIAFEVPKVYKSTPNVRSMKLYGENYHVYSVTYLCYGAFEIYRRYHASLVTNRDDVTTVLESPCDNTGNLFNRSAKFLFEAPCTTTPEINKWVFLNEDKMNESYSFVGTFDLEKCRSIVSQLFDYKECKMKKYEECFEPIDRMKMPDNFLGLSSFAYTTGFLKAKNTSLETYRARLKDFCLQDWNEVSSQKYPPAVTKSLNRYCFQGHAIETILTTGYGFNETTWSNLQFATTINKTKVGWALGYMINATNAIPAESRTLAVISTPLFVILLFVSLVMLGLGIFFCLRAKKSKRLSNSMS